MNELLNEGLVPHNFSWRAGIGKNVQQTSLGNLNFNPTTKGFDPLAPGSVSFGMQGVDMSEPSEAKKIKLQKQQELTSKIDDIATRYSTPDKDYITIKNDIITDYIKLRNDYDQYLDADYYKGLYKICILQYTNVWCKECADQNIQEFKSTEFLKVGQELHINPLLVYSLFTRSVTGITDVSPIDNEIKLIQVKSTGGGKSMLQGFIEEIDMIYKDVMSTDCTKEVYKMKLLSRLQPYKTKYKKFLQAEHDNVYNYCSGKPIEYGQFIYDIFYSNEVRINE